MINSDQLTRLSLLSCPPSHPSRPCTATVRLFTSSSPPPHLLLTSSSPPVFVPHVLFSQFKTLYFIFFSPPFPPLNVFSAPPHHLLFLLLITSFYFLSSLLLLHMYLWKNWQNFPFIYLHHPPLSSLTPSSPPLHLLFSCCCVFLPLLHVAPAEQIQTHHTRLHCIFGCFNSVGLSV